MMGQAVQLGATAEQATALGKQIHYALAYYCCEDADGQSSNALKDGVILLHMFAGMLCSGLLRHPASIGWHSCCSCVSHSLMTSGKAACGFALD